MRLAAPHLPYIDTLRTDAPRPSPLRRATVGLLLALALAGCLRADPDAATAPDDPQELSPAWRDAFQQALQPHLRALAADRDPQRQRDLLRLQPLLRDFYTEPAPDLARERLDAIARVRAAYPDEHEADWYHAELCVRPNPPASQGCDPGPALRRLQAGEPDNAAVWLLAADAADARQDPAGFVAALRRAAGARRYDIHYARHWAGVAASLQQLPLPALDLHSRRYLRRARASEASVADLHAALASSAVPLPLPASFVQRCRRAAPDWREDCVRAARLMADSDTLIGQTLGLSLLARLSAGAADGPAWRARLRDAYWLNAQAREMRQPAQFVELLPRLGEVDAYRSLLRVGGRDRAPPGWQPATPLARELVRSGRPLEPDP